MDSQNQHKLPHSSSGHENHGVHVCHKCGWPFPNPHPSAKHRRAHRKVCGTIEGYKFGVDLEGSAHSNVSVDEHLSDEDHKTPNPKVLEASGSEKGSGGAGELPNRSEDEVFSDAVAEFVDGGSGTVAGTRGGPEDAGELAIEKVVEKESEAIRSVDCGPVAEAVKRPGITTGSIQVQHSETQESTSNILMNAPAFPGPSSSSAISSVSDCQTEFSALPVDSDRNASADDLIPFKSETQKDASLESEKTKAIDGVFDSSSTLAEQGTDVEGKKETVSDSHSPDVKISTSEVAAETTEVVEPSPEKLPEDGFVCSKISETEVPAEVESIEHAVADARDVSEGINYVNLDYVIEKKGEVDANVHLISVPDDVHEVDNPKIMLEDFKDHKVLNLHQSATKEFGLSEDNGDEIKSLAVEESGQSTRSERTVISAPDSDVLAKDVAIEGEADSTQISESQGSDEVGAPREVLAPLTDKIASDSPPAEKESYDVSSEALPNSALDGTVQSTHSGLSRDHNSKGAIESDYTEKPVTLPELAISASENHVKPPPDLREGEDAGSSENVDIGKVETAEYAGDDSNESRVDNSNGLVKESFLENAVVAPESAEKSSGLEVDRETDLYGVATYEGVEIEKADITGDDRDAAIGNVKDETGVDNSAIENVRVPPEPAIKLEELNVNPANGLQEGNVTSDHGMDITERRVKHGTETKEDPLMQTPESASHLQESQTVRENIVCVNTVSDAQLGEEKRNRNDELQEVTPSLNSVEDRVKERALSPLDAKLSIQSTSAAEDNSVKEPDMASVFGSESFQGESDGRQLGSSVIDLSVDSSSRTDSLENNWGSVSVLSLQSDAQAVIDAETISPNESRVAIQEKNNSKQSKPSTERQHSDKSDLFEPPSFLTLVEPRGENGQQSNTSEIYTSQNPQQPTASSLQAGWFPSITHAAHESQGRKKNEEIIAKVTNWSAGKQHTPLKSLLGEASLETRAKSPKRKDVLQKGDKPASTVNSILAPESPLGQPAGKEIGKEWDSPARYQAEIKREKRKPKSRPYWAQFMCCSSVH